MIKNIKILKTASMPMAEIEFGSKELEEIAEKVARKIVKRDLTAISAKLDEIDALMRLVKRYIYVASKYDSIINRKLYEILGVVVLADERIQDA